MKHTVIAIDGYSSSGKSTLAKDLARHLGFIHIDTGAMYRAVTLYVLDHHIDIQQGDSINWLTDIHITFKNIDGKNRTFLNDVDVEEEIRSLRVSNYVSEVAAIGEVRTYLVNQQQEMAEHDDLVMDGRDIGTVVFPDAHLKLFVTATLEERARRRFTEAQKANPKITYADVKSNLEKRDHIDTTRAISPLKQAADAHLIDNSHLSKEEQLKLALVYLEDNKDS